MYFYTAGVLWLWHRQCVGPAGPLDITPNGEHIAEANRESPTTRLLAGFAVTGLALLLVPGNVRADDDDDNGDGYRNGGGYRNNHENRPNGNPSGNNITDQPGQSYEQSRRAGGESREMVDDSSEKPAIAWLKEAMSGNAAEVAAGAMAMERGASPEIGQFGQRMVTDHTKELDELADLARKYGVDPIREPVMPQQWPCSRT